MHVGWQVRWRAGRAISWWPRCGDWDLASWEEAGWVRHRWVVRVCYGSLDEASGWDQFTWQLQKNCSHALSEAGTLSLLKASIAAAKSCDQKSYGPSTSGLTKIGGGTYFLKRGPDGVCKLWGITLLSLPGKATARVLERGLCPVVKPRRKNAIFGDFHVQDIKALDWGYQGMGVQEVTLFYLPLVFFFWPHLIRNSIIQCWVWNCRHENNEQVPRLTRLGALLENRGRVWFKSRSLRTSGSRSWVTVIGSVRLKGAAVQWLQFFRRWEGLWWRRGS